jgi:anti-sigma regulatory factor (Ser/Thr protein kinase)
VAPSEARATVRAFEDLLPEPLVDDLALIVSELSTNVIRHAALEPGASFELRINFSPPVVRVEVRDEGLVEAAPGSEHPNPTMLPESGWGLELVRSLSSRCSLKRIDGTSAWAELDLTQGKPETA